LTAKEVKPARNATALLAQLFRENDEPLQPTLLLSLSKTVSYMKTRAVKTTLSYSPKRNSTQNFHISPPIYV